MTSDAPTRLRLDGAALVANWRWLDETSGAARCGAAIKADGYGLGAREVAARLSRAGCRDYFVATWGEAIALGTVPDGCTVSVLHGVRDEDMEVAVASAARPVINTLAQLARWRKTGRPCDVMVDIGMNRLGLSIGDVLAGALVGVEVVTLMSHLARADEDDAMNVAQRDAFAALAGKTRASAMSLANSAGVCLGASYGFDLTRPGLALYGGIARHEAEGHIAPVVHLQAQVLQVRRVKAGDTVGYCATWTARRPTEVAILNIGYADGYARALSNVGTCDGGTVPVVGRVSMDLTAVDVTGRGVDEGDWIDIDYDLPAIAEATGVSQYEVLTKLNRRFSRCWT